MSDSCWLRLRIGLIVSVTSALILLPFNPLGDDVTRLNLAREIANGNWPESKYSMLLPVFASVLIKSGRFIGAETLLVGMLIPALLAVATITLSSLKRNSDARTSFLTAAFCMLSLAGAYAGGLSSDLFSACLVAIGMSLAIDNTDTRKNNYAGMAMTVIGVANSPILLIPITVISLFDVYRRRQWTFLAIPLMSVVLIAGEASITSGSMQLTKYGSEGGAENLLPWGVVENFGYPILFGSTAVLFSLGRGIVFYIPAIWFMMSVSPSRHSGVSHRISLSMLILVPVYGSWWAWYGGVTFGPRFFLLLALSVAPVAARVLAGQLSPAQRVAGVSAVLIGSWVAAAGVVFGVTPAAFDLCVAEGFRFEPMCWYSAEYSSLLAPLWDRRFGVGIYEAFVIVLLISWGLVAAFAVFGRSVALPRFTLRRRASN